MVLEDYDGFIKDELLTDKELAARKPSPHHREPLKTRVVHVFKGSVYWFFGARFGTIRAFRINGVCFRDYYRALYIQVSNDGNMARIAESEGRHAAYKVRRWQTIKYTKGGEPYVTFDGRRYKLDMFLRVGSHDHDAIIY